MVVTPHDILDKLRDARFLSLAAGLFSAACLSFALYTQYFEGLQPCELCIWQRWPYGIIAVLGLIAFTLPRLALPLLFAISLAFLANAGIAVFHMGVEYKWWEGLSGCTPTIDFTLPVEQMLAQLEAAPVVRCDQIAWTFLGLSMAGWNAIICFVAGVYTLTIGLCALQGNRQKCEAA